MGSIPNGSAGDDQRAPRKHPGSSEPAASRGDALSALPEALSPAIASALEAGHGTLAERLALIREHSPRGGRYDFLSEVGSGAMGHVVRVWDHVLQRELALKIVHVSSAPPEDQRDRAREDRRTTRFIEEARITGQLVHPGIVPVHELAFDGQGQLYFAMPLVRGLTLARIFELVRAREEGWTLRRAIDVLHKVCLTVAFAHSKGVVHRDLKPDNIMVGPFGESYVMDWGLALIQGQSEHASYLGTPGYMAPEQLESPQNVGPASDVYSLGAILYDLLKGATPHQATLDASGSDFIDWAELMAHAPRPINSEALNVPPELVAICQRAMQRDVKQRYPVAQELAAEIARWMDGHVVEAHDTASLTRLKKWSRRNRALAAITLIIPIALGTLLFQQNSNLREARASGRRLEAQGYSKSLLYAKQHASAREMSLALQRLNECPEYLRGWEWDYLKHSIDAGAEVLVEQQGAVMAVAVSRGGEFFATGFDTGLMRLFAEPKSSIVIDSGAQAVRALEFHPTAPYLISGTSIGTDRALRGGVRLWNVLKGSLEREYLDHDSAVECLALSPDGKLLASADRGGVVHLEDLASGELVGAFSTDGARVSALAFDRKSDSILVCTPVSLRRWNMASGDYEALAPRFNADINDLLLGADGDWLWLACGQEILGLDSSSFALRDTLIGHAKPVTSLALDASGKRLLSGATDGRLLLWNLDSRTVEAEFVGHSVEVNDVAFLADGRRLLSGSEDESARIWSPGVQADLELKGHTDWIEGLSFNASGERLASSSRDGSLRLWSAIDGSLEQVIALEGSVFLSVWTSRERLVFDMGDSKLRVLDPEHPEQLTFLRSKGQTLNALIAHDRSDLLLGRYNDNTVHLWHADSEDPVLTFVTKDTYNYSQDFHPDGASFAFGMEDGSVELRSSASGEQLGILRGAPDGDAPESAVVSIAYSPDGRWLAAGNVHRQIVLWDLEQRRLARIMEGHDSQVTSLSFSPDGLRLASGSVDRSVRLWDPARGELLLTLDGHASQISALSFGPRGTQIASGSKGGELRLWRAQDPESLGQ